ncbi:DUF4955 domain-containing protein [Endozoicomonas ascidiicola]|uniref:DUF4955 domain-containing protein n=1 Tax=Endozoicomonas ascidiicola TaxID=1698521 RepID=UPI000837066A|nr:DUF4955 domain-containing protein [Endozoicomonas ascidiicola]
MKKLLSISIAIAIAGIIGQPGNALASEEPQVSQAWKNYLESRAANSDLLDNGYSGNRDLLVTNFSYAGYHRSEKPLPEIDVSAYCGGSKITEDASGQYRIFDIAEYGAVANDLISDKEAIRKAIAAAEAHVKENDGNNAILFIPKGQFRINEKSDLAAIDIKDPESIASQAIKIQTGNIVIKGCGAGENASELFMAESLLPLDPKKMWTTPTILQLGSKETTLISKINQPVVAGASKVISVTEVGNLKAGDWIEIEALIKDQSKVLEEMKPYKIEATMGGMKKGLSLREIHQVESVNGNTISLVTPIQVNVDPADDWSVYKSVRTENLGVEDIHFKGNWHTEFVHHGSAEHDSGYSAIQILKSANSWVRDVTLSDVSAAVALSDTTNSTVLDVTLKGTLGHLSLQFLNSFNNLSINFQDEADQWHSPGFSHYSSSNVQLDTVYKSTTSPDLHGAQPRINLFDRMTGGWMYGRWGAAKQNQPNHLKGLVFWNPKNTGTHGTDAPFELMRASGFGRIPMPMIVGLHGNDIEFASQKAFYEYLSPKEKANYDAPLPEIPQAHLESNGKPVFPSSLFLAQLEHRLDKLPEWLQKRYP